MTGINNRSNVGILSSADASQGLSATSETGSESESESESNAMAATLETAAPAETAADKSITVSAQALYGETVLTAETEITYYAALFIESTDETEASESETTAETSSAAGISTSSGTSSATGASTDAQTASEAETALTRISDVQALTIPSGGTVSGAVTFDGLTAGTYYVEATDAEGKLLSTSTSQASPQASAVEVTLTDEVTAETVVLQYLYTEAWPEDAFSYTVELSLTLNVVDRDGSALSGEEKFYISIYSDEAHTAAVTETPITFSMDGESTKTLTYSLKATSPSQTFYLTETDSTGAAVTTGENGFAYIVSFTDSDTVTVECGDTEASVTIQNKLNDSTITIQVKDASDGTLLSGAVLAVKDSSGNILEVETVGSKTFSSKTTQLVWTNALTDGETYYLTEITAPDGYTPVPDVEFTVIRGCTTEVVLANKEIVASDYALTVTKEVYVGDYQVYAYDTTTGSYKASGAYTYYVALFSDADRKNKVSNVVSLDVSGFTGTVTFSNLTENGIYYLSETDEYGVVVSSSSALTVRYTNSGKVQLAQKTSSMVVQNVYASLPAGYRYTGTLTLTMNTTDSSGTAEAVTNTFYIGIYRNADYSDTPTIVKMDFQNASSVTVRRRILLSGENDATYYIAEVDASGNRITDSSDFSYIVTVDKPTVTITKGANQTVTVTNKLKATKATLYLTKRVYEGTSQKAVSETFYAGLFKDAELTTLYADPIAMTLDNASELTLKLTLNLGSASGVTIYIAEVDQDGNVITNQRSFGYQIKILNATAVFTQDNLTIQTVIMNSVYGSTSDEDWESIIYSASSDLMSDSSYYTVDDNGSVSGEANSVQTGDDTPLLGYVLLMGAAMLLFGAGIRRRRGICFRNRRQ
ncbi:MAG: prealbumin-like fold domain-containing protein [Lachnospiraceae bacterium]|nr:prealbumin-like fold domain-containing protein [Lachnospiraceae bacterium]